MEDFIVTAATTRPEKLGLPFTHWSLRKLAGYLVSRKLRGQYESSLSCAAPIQLNGKICSSEPAPGRNPPIRTRTPSWT